MSIKKEDTNDYVSFYAYDSTDHITPKTGLSSFTVYYSLNNGAAAAMTTPTVAEKDATNMPGWYHLAIDETEMVSSEGELSLDIKTSGMDNVPSKVDIIGNTTKEVYDAVAALNDISVANIIAGIADGSYDLQEMVRIMFAALSGKSSGGGTTTLAFRDAADSKDRISETVDSTGNRTSVTRDGS